MKPEIEDLLQKKYITYTDNLTDEEKDDFWDNLDEKEKYQINKEYLILIGKPEYDYLVCWEPGRFDTDEEATNYDDFYSIDYSWWEYQKRAAWDSIEQSKKWMEEGSKHWTPEVVAKSINDYYERYETYEIYMTGDWYRLIDNDVFLYAQLISVKWYLYYKIETYLDDLEDDYIPYKYKKDEDLISLFNEQDPLKLYEAAGREKELDSFKEKMRKYSMYDLIPKIDTFLATYNDELTGKTFRIDTGYDDPFDPFTDFIFFDEQSLKNVNPKKFLATFKESQVDNSKIYIMLDELKSLIFKDFERIYNDNYKRFN